VESHPCAQNAQGWGTRRSPNVGQIQCVMASDNEMTSKERFRRSCIYALIAVTASSAALLVMAFLGGHVTAKVSGLSVTDLASYILAIPLVPGWLLIRGMFDKVGSCSSLDQILGPILLVPVISVLIDTGLIFIIWEFFHRKMSRGLGSDNILHIDR